MFGGLPNLVIGTMIHYFVGFVKIITHKLETYKANLYFFANFYGALVIFKNF